MYYFGGTGKIFHNAYKDYIEPWGKSVLGYTQYKNNQASEKAEIEYNEYLRKGYERQLQDFYKNEPGHTLRYPELSFPGQINRTNTIIARTGFSYDNAYANYIGGLAGRASGLYGISGKLYRSL